MAEERKAWERQYGETHQAFEAYDTYQKMGAKRSLSKVAEKLGKSKTLMDNWSSKWHWVRRAEEYDNELIRIELEEKQKAIAAMFSRHQQEGMLMQKKAIDALSTIDPSDLPIKLLVELIMNGAKLEKDSRLYGINNDKEETGGTEDRVVIINDTDTDE